jgi:hypothetical protein
MKTLGPILWPTGKIVIFDRKSAPGGHLEFQIFTKFLPDILSPIPTPIPNIKIIHQHLQLVERER